LYDGITLALVNINEEDTIKVQSLKAQERMQSYNNEGMNISFENRNGSFMLYFSGRRDNLSAAINFWECAIEECNKCAYKDS
jgi:hypothetical protein